MHSFTNGLDQLTELSILKGTLELIVTFFLTLPAHPASFNYQPGPALILVMKSLSIWIFIPQYLIWGLN